PTGNNPTRAEWRDIDDGDHELRRWGESLDDDPHDRRSVATANEQTPQPTRPRHAPAEGLHAARWWLRRDSRFPLAKAGVSGVVIVLASYVGGPLLGAGAALAGSALSLMSLGQAAYLGAGALAAVVSP